MSAVAGTGAAYARRHDGFKSKRASLAIVAVPVGATRETDNSWPPTSTQWKFLSSKGERLFAERSEAVGKQEKSAPCVRPSPPPAPRLRPSTEKAIVPFLALESDDESDEDQTPKCPAAPRLGSQPDPPFAAAMPDLMLPPSISSFDSFDWDDRFGFAFSELDEADSEAEGEHGSNGANIWNRMVSASASTACADDLEERGQSPGLPDILAKNMKV